MLDVDTIASKWLTKFDGAASSGDVSRLLLTILPNGWLRDALTFTWDTRSLEGHDMIASYLSNKLPAACLTNFKLDDQPGLRPQDTPFGIAFGFSFETAIGRGHGYAHLLTDESTEEPEWKAVAVCLMLEDIKGHEESGPESGVYGGHTLSWEELRLERRAKIENDPHVIIIGGGQSGLNIAARFKQMNIPSIVVEKNGAVGDQWRMRYPTLTLHTPRNHHALLYQSYPRNWPSYTPRGKLADWMQQYAESQDLVVWTNSTVLPRAAYDTSTKRWNLVVDRDGSEVELHPAHIVVAIGTLGAPRIPEISDRDLFHGEVLHASAYKGGKPFTGKRVIVVGAGNTAADMCQDLSFHGASSVTMVQRSSTCVVSSKNIAAQFATLYPDGMPAEICDFRCFSLPFGLQKKVAIANQDQAWAREKPLHDKLRKGGLKLNMGRDGGGQNLLIFERLGGYWVDVGCAELIESGQVKVKQGVEPKRFTENGLGFTDDTELDADVIIWATGYVDPRESLKTIFGDNVIGQTSELWGLDEEYEIRGSYRSSGYPGLWYGAGGFDASRFLSKQLVRTFSKISHRGT
ncbi:FAD/NAD-P-binding domain-containing protein [Sparassis crispa]|uniref:FAD/NAD-P-binding domain-containing protein n=1 Tax=Sparassis crispa TaxID=139825 RepID=A0A401G6B0_9APHY|nr:FAD/NAD-P-binding domain-containing protein [Sparassis crispa]GBE77698.1 FAD/NAD-P-binding domain-containing protein [Sparassis crispa]